MTVHDLIASCLPHVGLPISPIPTDVRDLGLIIYNLEGKKVWDLWPWDNTKLPRFTVTPDASGIITLPSTVDVVRAVRKYQSGNEDATTGIVWNQDEVLAMVNGNNSFTDHFEYLPDVGGVRRIQVETGYTGTWQVLALKKFVSASSLASTDDGYDAANDYTLISYPIDRAEPAVREYILDALRDFVGMQRGERGDVALQIALKREKNQSQRETRLQPMSPMFRDVGTR